MFERRSQFGLLALVLCLALVVAVGTGCPRWISKGSAKVTTVFTTDSNTLKTALLKALSDEKSVVDVNDIESLTVSLDGVTLDQEGSEDEETSTKAKIEVYGGSQDVDLINLTDLSEVLSSVEIPADTYTKIRLQISNPRLVLNGDPTVITDIHLTANDNLFIGTKFTLEDGEQTLLLLDFGGIHLTLNGDGSYVLTPQLRADLTLVDAVVEADGVIANLNTDEDTFTLVLNDGTDGELRIDYGTTPAQIFKDDGTDGDETNLADDLTIHVTGLLQVDGTVVADSVAIQPAAP